MVIKSLKISAFYNVIKTTFDLLFPLITFPYISRILLADGIGKISFAQALSGYFVYFALLGIPLYGIREVAKFKNSSSELTKLSIELILITFISSMFLFFLYFLLIKFNLKLQKDYILNLAFGFTILFSFLNVDWFFQGHEEYKQITIRGIIIRIVAIISMFLFIKNKSDYLLWGIINVLLTFVNNLVNFFLLTKRIRIFSIKNIELSKHVKPVFVLVSLNLITSIYTQLDVVMLGFMSNERFVGYYSTVVKINRLILAALTSLSAVLLPRFSYLFANGKVEEFRNLAQSSIKLLLLLIFPLFVGLLLNAKNLILLFAGKDFYEAIFALQILAPSILFVSISGFVGTQILFPLGKEKVIFWAILFGAIVNVLLNLTLIPTYFHNGAAFSNMIAELTVLIFLIIVQRRYFNLSLEYFSAFRYLINSSMMGLILFVLNKVFISEWGLVLILFFNVFIGSILYILFLAVTNDSVYISYIKPFLKKIMNR